MKKFKFNKISVITVLAIIIIFGITKLMPAYAASNPSLGAAATFSVIAQTAITGTPTSISGNVGMNNVSSSITGVAGPVVTGTIYATDASPVAPGEAVIDSAVQADLTAAYSATKLLPIEGTPIVVSELGGITTGPGVYDIPGNATLSGVLTLDGAGTYIFRTASSSSLTSSAGGSINFINGARACNLFWNIGTEANIGGTSFAGTIIAHTGVHFMNDGVALNGRALAEGADVTLNTNGSISGPTCAPSLLLQKTIAGDGSDLASAWTLIATGILGGTDLSGITGAAGADSDLAFPNATFQADTYTLAESGVTMTNYTPTYSCSNVNTNVNNGVPTITTSSLITLVAGDVATCIITNTYTAPATLNVIKHVVTNNGGVATANAWTLAVTSSNSGSGTGSAVGSETGTMYTLQAGKAYNVTESGGPSGYLETDSADCTIASAVAGTSYTCTITNDDIAVSSGSSGGSSTVYGCNDQTATNYNAFSQSNPALCIYDVVSPLIHVTKVPSPLALLSGPGIVTYTEQVTNPGVTALSNIIITDDKCSPLTLVSGDANVDAKLDSTETWTYTCQANLTKTTTNTATVEGTANGLIVKDSAIATVVVSTPGLPKTGFPPQEPWYMVILSDFLNLIK